MLLEKDLERTTLPAVQPGTQAVRQSIQRTLVLAVGDLAESAVAALQTEAIQQDGAVPPALAWVTLNLDQGPKSWEEAIRAKLLEISRLDNRSQLSRLGFELGRLDEVSLWITADLTMPANTPKDGAHSIPDGAWLVELATLCAELTAQTLNVTPAVAGLLLYDNSPGARKALEALDQRLQETECFNHGCYLLNILNQDSLALPDRATLAKKAGLLLYLLTATALQDIEDLGGFPPARQPRYASLGVHLIQWEPERLQAVLARERARDGLQSFLAEPQPEAITPLRARLESGLRRLGLAPILLMDVLVPEELRADWPYPGAPLPWNLADFPAQIRGRGEEWAKTLERYQAEGKLRVDRLFREKGPALDKVVQEAVSDKQEAGDGTPGMTANYLAESRIGWAAVRATITDWMIGLDEKAAAYEESLSSLRKAAQEAESKLTELIARFPAPSLLLVPKLMTRPWRWIPLYRLYQEIDSAGRRLWLLQAAVRENHLARWTAEIALALLEQLQARVEEREESLQAWRQALVKTQQALSAGEQAEPVDEIWKDSDFQARLTSRLESPNQGGHLALPYSPWEAPPPPEEMAAHLIDLTTRQLDFLSEMEVLEALGKRLIWLEERAEWLRAGLEMACPLWQVDPTRLDDFGRGEWREAEAFLRPESFSQADEEAWPGTERITHYNDRGRTDRLALVRVQSGVPLSALL